ncbi:MAG: DNA-binding protein WhiA, partial [Oscillospiraceae bacterium]|nr:DNA-binding protein WhiA [Oscillospiraceae bacterium]
AAFIAGAFLTGGTVTRPSSGYHLEFSTYKKNLCDDFEELLSETGYKPKRTSRGYLKVLYYKNSGVIEDILSFMGASSSAFELMNEKILKGIVNSVNRLTNCENANIDKTVNSAAQDIECIRLIKSRGGERQLSDELSELARLREENPELSMSELGALLNPPLTKSGVSHRLRKLRRLAAELREDKR